MSARDPVNAREMTLPQVFLSPFGRISRLEWWLGYAAVTAVSVAVIRALDPEFFDLTTGPRPPALAITVWNTIQNVVLAMLSIKRFNDCDLPYWTGLLLLALQLVFVFGSHFGHFLDVDRMIGFERIVFIAIMVYFIWALYYNGFVRGTNGPNHHGCDPLA